MEDNKYYTPSIEELHVGLEYVYNVGTATEPNWQEGFLIDESWQVQSVHEELPFYIRVKYLDKEDIESLGFILSNKDHTDSWDVYKKGNYELLYAKNRSCLDIWQILPVGAVAIVVKIKIKNFSELKVLLKQLGIYE